MDYNSISPGLPESEKYVSIVLKAAELAAYMFKRSGWAEYRSITTKDKMIARRTRCYRVELKNGKRIIDVGRTRTYAPEGN